MVRLTKKRFHELIAQHHLLIAGHQVDALYLDIMREIEGDEGAAAVGKFVAVYIAAFKQRYGVAPAMSGPDKGAAKNIVKSQGLDAACKLVGAYLRSNDGYFRQRSHDLMTLQANLGRVHLWNETGRTVTQTEARRDDHREANIQAARAYLDSRGDAEEEGDGPEGVR